MTDQRYHHGAAMLWRAANLILACDEDPTGIRPLAEVVRARQVEIEREAAGVRPDPAPAQRAAIVYYLNQRGSLGARTSEIAARLKIEREPTRSVLRRMERDGVVVSGRANRREELNWRLTEVDTP